jgi:hypothetical protein
VCDKEYNFVFYKKFREANNIIDWIFELYEEYQNEENLFKRRVKVIQNKEH